MIIYADILFLINFLSAYVLTGIMRRFKKRAIKISRRILSSCCVGISALIIFITDLEHYVTTAIYIATSVLTVYICFGKKSLLLNSTIFCMLNILLCGTAISFISLSNASPIMYIKNNIIYFNINAKIFIAAFALSYPLLCIFSLIIRRRAEKKLHSITIINKDKSLCVSALYDSGNLLKEPITQKNVIILDKVHSDKIITENQEFIKIPYSTINGTDYMYAFVADAVIIDDKNILPHQYIAIAKENLCSTDEYCALLGDMGGF